MDPSLLSPKSAGSRQPVDLSFSGTLPSERSRSFSQTLVCEDEHAVPPVVSNVTSDMMSNVSSKIKVREPHTPERINPCKYYLKTTLGPALASCMAELCLQQPEDPFEFMARWLYRYADFVLYSQEKVELLHRAANLAEKMRRERKMRKERLHKLQQKYSELLETLREIAPKQFQISVAKSAHQRHLKAMAKHAREQGRLSEESNFNILEKTSHFAKGIVQRWGKMSKLQSLFGSKMFSQHMFTEGTSAVSMRSSASSVTKGYWSDPVNRQKMSEYIRVKKLNENEGGGTRTLSDAERDGRRKDIDYDGDSEREDKDSEGDTKRKAYMRRHKRFETDSSEYTGTEDGDVGEGDEDEYGGLQKRRLKFERQRSTIMSKSPSMSSTGLKKAAPRRETYWKYEYPPGRMVCVHSILGRLAARRLPRNPKDAESWLAQDKDCHSLYDHEIYVCLPEEMLYVSAEHFSSEHGSGGSREEMVDIDPPEIETCNATERNEEMEYGAANREEFTEDMEHGAGMREEFTEHMEYGAGRREELAEDMEYGAGRREEFTEHMEYGAGRSEELTEEMDKTKSIHDAGTAHAQLEGGYQDEGEEDNDIRWQSNKEEDGCEGWRTCEGFPSDVESNNDTQTKEDEEK